MKVRSRNWDKKVSWTENFTKKRRRPDWSHRKTKATTTTTEVVQVHQEDPANPDHRRTPPRSFLLRWLLRTGWSDPWTVWCRHNRFFLEAIFRVEFVEDLDSNKQTPRLAKIYRLDYQSASQKSSNKQTDNPSFI